MSADSVTHRGIVERIDNGSLVVRLTDDDSHCDGCSITALCTGRATDGPVIIVTGHRGYEHLKVGDTVVLTATSRATMFSIILLFVIPLVILVSIVLYGASHDWGIWSVIGGIGAMFIYDGILFYFRHRLASRIRWNVTVVRED